MISRRAQLIILPEDRDIVALLSQEDARQLLFALFSDPDDLPELSQVATVVYTVIKGKNDRITERKSKAGKQGGASQNNQNAKKQAEQADSDKTSRRGENKQTPEKQPTVSVPDTVSVSGSVPVPVPNPESKGQDPKDICAEPSAKAGAPRQPPAMLLPLNDKSDYPVSEEQAEEWAGLYPAVDVMQQLRSMRGWLLASPTRRKTRAGIQKFINAWLSREQDRGSNTGPGQDWDRKENNHANSGGAFGRRDAGGPVLPPADRDKDRDWIKGFVNALDDLDDLDDFDDSG